jgi:hypothetical protein
MKAFLLILLFLNIAAAQNGGSDIINGLIVPTVVVCVLAYGVFSFFKLPKVMSLIVSVALTALSYFLGTIQSFSSIVLSMGGLASTGVYISLFLLGTMLASRSVGGRKKMVKYIDARRMSRKQLSQEMTNIERRMSDLQARLEKIKIQEHSLELQFSNNKNPQIAKELDRVRKLKNELSDALDMLIERREAYKRAYREATV